MLPNFRVRAVHSLLATKKDGNSNEQCAQKSSSGEKGRRIRELASLVQKRFKFPENSVELYAERVNNRGLCAIAQAESLRYMLLGGLAVRRFFIFFLIFNCQLYIIILIQPIFVYMVSSGQPVKEYIDSVVRHVLLRQGVLGIKVKIMLDWDPTGKLGPKTPLPDNVIIHMPKDDVIVHPPKEVEGRILLFCSLLLAFIIVGNWNDL